jgi:hypothetical protein
MARKKKRKRPFDPVMLLVNAQSYLASSVVLDAQPNKVIFLWPMITVEAFALELFIKCLHRVRRRTVEGHDIHSLYHKLSVSDQKKIAKYFAAIVSRHPDYEWAVANRTHFDVESVLLRNKDMFTKTRYWHEGAPPNRDSFGSYGNAGTGSLAEAIRDLIFELRPKWMNLELAFGDAVMFNQRPT